MKMLPIGTLNKSSKEPGIQESANQIINKLTAAIQAGESESAKYLVDQLASLKLKVDITLPKEENDQRSKEKEFCVKVHVEDRVSDGCYFSLMVKACDTIEDLKRKVMLMHNFPMEVQRWIIGKKIYNDKDKLGQCGIKGPNHILYLYLVTARSVGLTQQDYEQQRQPLFEGRLPHSSTLLQSSRFQSKEDLSNLTSSKISSGHSPTNLIIQGLNELEQNMAHSNMASRQASKVSLSSPGSFVSDLMATPGIASQISNANAPSERPKSISSDNALMLEGQPPSSGYRSRTPPRSPSAHKRNEPPVVGWECSFCTLINLPTRPGCEACSAQRPANYCIPAGYQMTPDEIILYENSQQLERMTREAEEAVKKLNFQELLEADDLDLVPNWETFACPVCFDEIDQGQGIVLRECLHSFCKACLMEAVRYNEDAIVKCPYQDDEYSCQSVLQEREIKALVPTEIFQRYLQRGLDQAESATANSYHCKTADCHGWCIYEDLVNFFQCPVCKKENCLTCKAIHENINCKEYQDNLRMMADNNEAAKQTQEFLERLVADGKALHCPQCSIIIQKKDGCDWIKCSICKLEICWVTKGPRWGPRGEGDITGGCKCRVNQNKCHPQCINCH